MSEDQCLLLFEDLDFTVDSGMAARFKVFAHDQPGSAIHNADIYCYRSFDSAASDAIHPVADRRGEH